MCKKQTKSYCPSMQVPFLNRWTPSMCVICTYVPPASPCTDSFPVLRMPVARSSMPSIQFSSGSRSTDDSTVSELSSGSERWIERGERGREREGRRDIATTTYALVSTINSVSSDICEGHYSAITLRVLLINRVPCGIMCPWRVVIYTVWHSMH